MSFALASVFTSHMVLQQGMPVPVWGTAESGSRVVVSFSGKTAEAAADSSGKWMARLGPLDASAEPAALVVTAKAADGKVVGEIVCEDVLVGEVWVCSGQSNMQWTVAQADDPAANIAAADAFPLIRFLQVARRPEDQPTDHLDGAAWEICSSKTVEQFSAVGYYFGLELHKKLGVPIGLINSAWGGTIVEAWTSREGLMADAEGRTIAEAYDAEAPLLPQRMAEYEAAMQQLTDRTTDKQNLGHARGWAGDTEPSDAAWRDMLLPGTWQHRGLEMSGVVWFRKEIDIPPTWAGKDLSLSIGATDKSDTTYFNNEQVGSVRMEDRPDAWSVLRTYRVPGRLVKVGRNVIAVRVHSNMFAGGMTGPAEMMHIQPADNAIAADDDAPLGLAGAWRYAVEADYGLVKPPAPPAGPASPNRPSVLYNGMIAPLLPMALRGAVWYQGESNASRARQYRSLFPTLIRDWRNKWGRDDLAFHFVQLANFGLVRAEPGQSNWAQLREAQAMALSLPHTGMAVTIDIGDPDDIHPTNKQDVGQRLACSALHRTYGRDDVVPSGPIYREAKREGAAMRIVFDYAADGLVSRGGPLQGFAIAGSDGRFVWADAKIDGATVVVSSPEVPKPTAVRYGWADSPDCNLYNSADLPASPFRTDAD